MSIIGSVKVNSHPVAEILRRKGLDMNGDVQRFHTANVLRRIVRYMPIPDWSDHQADTSAVSHQSPGDQ